jgi:hypothetical protein
MASRTRKRRRQRAASTAETSDRREVVGGAAATRARARTGRGADERPPAPWGSFPLVELVVLVALAMLIAGAFVGGSRGATLLGTGLVLGSLAGLELSIREHFGGYRSHTTLLSGAVAVATLLALYYAAELSPAACVAGGLLAGVIAAWLLLRAFRARAGRLIKLK